MEQKKNSNFIIPATFFTSLAPTKKQVADAISSVQQSKVVAPPPKAPEQKPKEETKPSIKNIKRRTSALSFKGLQQKKETQVVEVEEENYDNHPRTPFTQEQLEDAWKKYYFKLQELGEKNIASILLAGQPKKQQNFEVIVTLPNTLMKNQLEKGKPALLKFIRERINNYGLAIHIKVSETVEKKFAYTPQEKYAKLREKNPLLDKLKQTFGLDV